jgi:phage gpG-like protein
LYDRLAERFGAAQVFMDVDKIEPGVNFPEAIRRALATSKVLLAVIGPHWLTAADQLGRQRLNDPEDFVRLEIEAALARDVRVIPILVEGADLPGQHDLPDSLADLAHRNAFSMRHETFRYDAERLVTAIEGIVDTAAPVRAETPGEAAQKGPERVRGERARTTRILIDAERLAQSITDENSKAPALLVVAGALAAADPDRAARHIADAERLAQSITDENSRASALTGVARALAAADPDRAERTELAPV